MANPKNKKKVIILGGGMAGLSAAMHLTDNDLNPGWKDRYDVTIYTLGWRIGGKAASSRNPEYGERIEEHGIHIFSNYYHNVFSVIKKAAKESKWKGMPVKRMDKLFFPNAWSLYMEFWDKKWDAYMLPVNDNQEDPWTGTGQNSWMASKKDILYSFVQAMFGVITRQLLVLKKKNKPKYTNGIGFLETLFKSLNVTKSEANVISFLEIIKDLLEKWAEKAAEVLVEGFLDFFNTFESLLIGLRDLIKKHFLDNRDLRRIFIIFDYYSTLIRGCLKEGVFEKDYDIDDLDDINYIDWLKKWKIDEITLNSSVPHMPCNVCFQYKHGDASTWPLMSTSSYIIFSLRFLLGKGAYIYHFLGGSGETLMTPIYHCLKKRGVKFEFFSKVTELTVGTNSKGKKIIDSVKFERQVKLRDPTKEYYPLRKLVIDKLGEWDVWPNQPDYSQIDPAQAKELQEKKIDLESYYTTWKGTEEVLKVGKDYDEVVLAISLGALPYICKNLIANNKKWKKMVNGIDTIETVGVQIWCKKTMEEMGFNKNDPIFYFSEKQHGSKIPICTTFPPPLNDFADFSDLIEYEKWSLVPESERPKSCLYFCGPKLTPIKPVPFSDTNYPERARIQLEAETASTLRSAMGAMLLPKAAPSFQPFGFDFNLLTLAKPNENNIGADRIKQQWIRANIDPTERYVPAFPGQVKNRLHAWESGYRNLTICGDWIYCGFNLGSIEAAAMSGALASYALTGKPDINDIPGYLWLHARQKNIRASRHPLAAPVPPIGGAFVETVKEAGRDASPEKSKCLEVKRERAASSPKKRRSSTSNEEIEGKTKPRPSSGKGEKKDKEK